MYAAHSWSVKLDADSLAAKNFNESNVRWATLLLDGSLGANKTRSDDPLMLYPVWRVGIALDKWYGYMYGIEVDVWADTKEVRSVQEAWSTLPPPEGTPIADVNSQTSMSSEVNPNLSMLVPLSTITIAIVGTTIVWIARKKRLHSTSLLRPFSKKTGGILLCVLLSSMMLLASIATVNATTRGAAVWGSESTGAIDPNTQQSWRKSPTEIADQQYTASVIATCFANNGYTGNNGINHQGSRNPGSTVGQIEGDTGNLQYYNDYVAVVDFDHGVGGYPINAPPLEEHYMFEDNTGTVIGGPGSSGVPPEGHYTNWNHGVYDMSIYQLTQPNKIIFAFISACQSADTTRLGQGLIYSQWNPSPRAIGMPFAWTHRLVADKSSSGFNIGQFISNDGYGNPDWGYQVYIGFPYGSASLSQGIPFGGGGGNPYYYWVYSFFYHALYYDQSVNQALDSASWQFMGNSFGASPLRNGFPAWWWNMGDPVPGCTMAVYGNGNIHLKQFTPPSDSPSMPSVGGPTAGDSGTSYQFSAFATDPYAHSIQYTFDWGDGSPQTVTDWYSDGATAYASHSWSSGGLYSVTVKAQCSNGAWSSWSSPLIINIDNQPVYHWLTVDAYDAQYWFTLHPNVYIDGNWVGTAGVSVLVGQGDHSVWVDDPVWNENLGFYQYLQSFSDSYGNGDYRPIYFDTEITAFYY